jgi:hypothetical protein
MKLRVAFAIALTMSLVVPGIALADTRLRDRGQFGEHRLRDRWKNPGAICNYNDSSFHLQSIEVRPPLVFARDVTLGQDQQDVGWQFWIRRHLEGGGKVTHNTSSTQIATATDTAHAPFTRVSTAFVPNYPGPFTVVVRMFWYEAGGAISGMAKHRIDHYTQTTEGDGGPHEWSCETGLA